MAENTFHLVIASVGQNAYDGAAVSANIPTTSGEITVLPHHQPLVSTLRQGTIRVRLASGETKDFSIDGGVLEISGNRAVVLL